MVIQSTLNNMSQFYENIIEAKEQDVKIQPNEKRKYFKSIAIQNLLTAQDYIPISIDITKEVTFSSQGSETSPKVESLAIFYD